MNLTSEKIASYLVENKETETANFINSKAAKIYCASYRTGAYGRIFANFIKNNYPLKLNFNGALTDLAIETTRQMECKGYSFQHENNTVKFSK